MFSTQMDTYCILALPAILLVSQNTILVELFMLKQMHFTRPAKPESDLI